ncbi:FMN-binding protein [Flagellimonas sp. 2504JD1-5]
MRTRFMLLALLILIVLGCKEKTEKEIQKPITVEVEKPKKLPSEIIKIAHFAGISLSDSIDISSRIGFKTLDSSGKIDSVDMGKAIKLYKAWLKSGQNNAYPLFEIKDADDVIITTASKGYGGNIRGTFLINRTSLEIKKTEFEHMAESEGYGAAIANSSFEDQFVGAIIGFDRNSFGLNQNGKQILKGIKTIDGISGATTTSQLTVKMVNDELGKYKGYFLGHKGQ